MRPTKPGHRHPPRPEDGSPAPVWVVGRDPAMWRRIATLMDWTEPPWLLPPETAADDRFWKRGAQRPRLILLDLEGELDWGRDLMRRARRARLEAPVVVLAESFSRDFGAKIISEGILFHFSRDFCDEEFISVLRSLLATHPGERAGRGRDEPKKG